MKTVLILGGERMNAQAQAALLKTLEEPSASSRIILVVRQTRLVLATLRSRCTLLTATGIGNVPDAGDTDSDSVGPLIQALFGSDPDAAHAHGAEKGEATLEQALREGPGRPSLALSWSPGLAARMLSSLQQTFGMLALSRMGSPLPDVLEPLVKPWAEIPPGALLAETDLLERAATAARLPGSNAKGLAAEALGRLGLLATRI